MLGLIGDRRLAIAVDRQRLGAEPAGADRVAADARGDERFAHHLGRGRLRRSGRVEDRHELLDVGRGGVTARQRGSDVGGQLAHLQGVELRAATAARRVVVRRVRAHWAIAPSLETCGGPAVVRAESSAPRGRSTRPSVTNSFRRSR